ncbi:UMP kinase [Candidatus Daviesbacteria bacterium RIFCSPHIGHO2_01_FULL_44_29]|uniref:Uridylate kinase n=1 Tax=Candidatus Daviesbacteria bacterium RIFCSPHIGHO2_02_FULL_43_12 TaxID=1797776 RepID=A0A1F5KHQ0_9BACT|nr:MAG: UMP kinase [Candidatus Daviesbacteria bacterium RIFCSPHIGHO2_01_FULL_44_29]OGE38932.1 MAG: UMP kinase [Candidatus Daviesbacteria bacterium RIFCSPHIGHO2_12_FULL_47_45]OGE40442.1 MAG: UMP kinase [Candidatus Daviesbacteria bacterium RIFCSPHIGHO2_02_FULL_43_12]OGE69714.1 MAG: UMP kinase [Candidatus Daviesbacteria bacterium RIFCSPLOWO2_01_FULL_43_15]
MSGKYKRVLLKITGELFGGEDKKGLDFEAIGKFAKVAYQAKQNTGTQLVILMGAGNLFRGREVAGTNIDRATADYIGMLGTIMNALALQEELERLGDETRVLSSLPIPSVCETYIRRRALRHLEKNRTIILAGGMGNPFFTTDTASALKALELDCEILLKGSNVEGIYSADPSKDKNATLYKKLTFQEAIEKGLTVMDNTAFALCQREHISVVVFNIHQPDNIEKIIRGEEIGTLVV